MALIVADRVKETTVSTGTGAITLAGAMTGFKTFSSVCANSDTCYYAIQAVDGSGIATGDWEIGLGTYTTAGNTLTRTSVIASTNSNALVNFAAGTKHVWIDVPAIQINSLNQSVATVTGTHNETSVYGTRILLANAAGGAVTINLPSAVNNLARYLVKKIDSSTNTVTIDPASSETIDGSATAVISVPNVALGLVSNGTNWYVI